MEHDLDFANTNSLWGSFLVETLFRLGIRHAVVAPGSRSAPLAYAFARHPGIKATPILDERSASFFALGIARRVRRPVALVCTSGTAVANFYPAVIEARESGVSLFILTADRPPEMRDCASGQTIDQVKVFGHYPRWQAEVALPEATAKMLAYLRQTMAHACKRAQWPVPGPVHLNLPFRDPLAPVADGSLDPVDRTMVRDLLTGIVPVERCGMRPSRWEVARVVESVANAERLLIVAGPALPGEPEAYVEAVLQLAKRREAPVLADALSPVRQRGYGEALVLGNYDFLLERGTAPAEAPDLVLRLGTLPTSKRLRRWLAQLDCPQLIVEEGDQNVDPLHSRSVHVRAGVEALVEEILPLLKEQSAPSPWARGWVEASGALAGEIAATLAACEALFEGKIPWLLAKHAPVGAAVFVSNSTPIRDAEYFWQSGKLPHDIYFNRGANGIDGIVSTAMGVASETEQTFLVTGDLTFLHDQNGLLNARALSGGLTILLINNGGGGIFRALPVAAFDPPFTDFFLTPQRVAFSPLCAAHGIDHRVIRSWQELVQVIEKPWKRGVRVVEILTDSAADQARRTAMVAGTFKTG